MIATCARSIWPWILPWKTDCPSTCLCEEAFDKARHDRDERGRIDIQEALAVVAVNRLRGIYRAGMRCKQQIREFLKRRQRCPGGAGIFGMKLDRSAVPKPRSTVPHS